MSGSNLSGMACLGRKFESEREKELKILIILGLLRLRRIIEVTSIEYEEETVSAVGRQKGGA